MTTGLQPPAPSQTAEKVSMPLAQLGLRQAVAAPGYVQAATVTPLHAPPQTVPSVAHAGRGGTGAPVTGTQVPPPPTHAWHCPPHALLQQT